MSAGKISGHCLCGAVTYSSDAEPLVQAVCHCEDCQRQTGGPFTVVVGVPRDSLSVQGETLASYKTVGTDHGGETERSFCSRCGAPLFSFNPTLPDFALIKVGSLDDASWVAPVVEVWTGSAQPWAPRFDAPVQMERGS